ncbi:MAG TPA: Dabb family protein [Gemmataceae bacterium]|nr:Dabb family protein [Gemmataceae bacterium]
MRTVLACCVFLTVVLAAAWWLSRDGRAEQGSAAEPMVVHNVYFSLKDNSPQAKEKLVAACKKYLSKHPGEVFFAAGTLAEEFNRPVNDRDFDVALHLVFKNKEAHDKYQDAPRHKQFIDENKDNWKKVRVFDSLVRP